MHHRTASVNTGMVSLIFSACFFEKEKRALFAVRPRRRAYIYISSSVWISGFDEGSPDGNDPLVLARQMAARGITLVCTLVSRFAKVPVSDPLMRIPTVLRGLRASAEQLLGMSSLDIILFFSHLPLFSLRRTFTRRSSISHPA